MRWARGVLQAAGCDSPSLDAQLLLAHVLVWERSGVLAHPEAPLGDAAAERYRRLVARRARREPLAYIVARRAFWGMDLEVRPGVLVPRPETETLVEQALAWALRRGGRTWGGVLADVGTGSGAVAVALARELPYARVWATDTSPEALWVAQANARRYGVAHRIRVVQGEWLAPVQGPVDAIVSNPPYVPSGVLDRLAPEIARYEPRRALDGGPDGLAAYRQLLPQAARALSPGGAIFLEVGHDQADAVSDLLRGHFPGWRVVRFRDLGGHWRVVAAWCGA
ncbi:MAG: peptide chain release factor N(5)-glutamine methyltransferase [Anaerolineae bacterium]|nr:peptide chain release factor N(5)-glutamine methyltransferase [Anaerolineae bacterium]